MKTTTLLLLAVCFLIISSCSVESIEEMNVDLNNKSLFVENGFAKQTAETNDIPIIINNPVVSAKRD